MRTLRVTGLAFALVVAVVALAACGGNGIRTYSNEDYGVSFDYDAAVFAETTDTSAQGSVGGNSVLNVGFFDTEGTKTNDEYRDGFLLNVYKLNQQITSDLMPAVKTELEKLLPQLVQAFGGDAQAGELKDITVAGLSGFTTDATYTMDGADFKATMYFLIADDLELQLTMQAAESRWSELEPKFQQVVDTFSMK